MLQQSASIIALYSAICIGKHFWKMGKLKTSSENSSEWPADLMLSLDLPRMSRLLSVFYKYTCTVPEMVLISTHNKGRFFPQWKEEFLSFSILGKPKQHTQLFKRAEKPCQEAHTELIKYGTFCFFWFPHRISLYCMLACKVAFCS